MISRNSKAVSFLTKKLPSTAPFWRVGMVLLVCMALFAGCGGGDPRLTEALENIENPDGAFRLQGLKTFSAMGEQAKPHANKIAALLKDDSADVRIAAIGVLVGLKDNSPEFVQELVAMAAGDEDANAQSNALHALMDIGANEQFLKGCKEIVAGDDAEKRGLVVMYLSEAAGSGVTGAKEELEAIASGSDKDAATTAKETLKSLEQ
jgi:hypothetical protein